MGAHPEVIATLKAFKSIAKSYAESNVNPKHEAHLRHFWYALHGSYSLFCSLNALDKDTLRQANSRLAEGLRVLVKAWIQSGFKGAEEVPEKRELSGDHQRSLVAYGREHAEMGIVQSGGLSYPIDPEYPELDDITSRSMLIREGALRRAQEGRSFINNSALYVGIGKVPELARPDAWEEYVAGAAKHLFLNLLEAGGERFRLVQCGRCDRYSFRKTQRKKYALGWHCPPCSKLAATAASKRKRDAQRQSLLIQLAVKEYAKYKPEFGQAAPWLKDKMKAKLSPREAQVTQWWVSRHLNEIADRSGRPA